MKSSWQKCVSSVVLLAVLGSWGCPSSTKHEGGTGGAILLNAGSGGHTGAGAAGANAGSAGSGGSAAADGGTGGTAAVVVSTACCNAHGTPGCDDATVQKCVCDQVASCCQSAWDLVCVELVSSLECGSCKADCCTSSSVTGCIDSQVEACVCKGDSSCCDDHWDDFCVTLVDGLSCGTCK